MSPTALYALIDRRIEESLSLFLDTRQALIAFWRCHLHADSVALLRGLMGAEVFKILVLFSQH